MDPFAAIVAMFLLPWLDARGVFDGPRVVRRRPHREVCSDCGALLLLACLALIQPVWLTALASPRTIRTTQWILLALGTIYPIRVGWNATP